MDGRSDELDGGVMSAVAAGIVAGSVADRIFGDPAKRHPVAGFGRAAKTLERALWRPRRRSGVVFTLTLVVATGAAAGIVDARLRTRPLARAAFVAAALWTALGGHSLGRAALRVADAVHRGDLDEARRLAPALVGRDPRALGGAELCRAAVESVAENTADAIVGPLFWGALAGPVGIVSYRAANTLDAMVGHHNERYEQFGWAAARVDDALTWPAARLAAMLTVLLAPLSGGNSANAWRVVRRDGGAHPSPNAGLLEAAFAGAFGVRLGGRNQYGDRVEERPAIGDGPAPDPDTVIRAVRLSELVGIAATAICTLAAWRLRR
ncbi:MAG: cobalamin biosynthesis protein [Myxococcota bacterium]